MFFLALTSRRSLLFKYGCLCWLSASALRMQAPRGQVCPGIWTRRVIAGAWPRQHRWKGAEHGNREETSFFPWTYCVRHTFSPVIPPVLGVSSGCQWGRHPRAGGWPVGEKDGDSEPYVSALPLQDLPTFGRAALAFPSLARGVLPCRPAVQGRERSTSTGSCCFAANPAGSVLGCSLLNGRPALSA